MIKIAMEFEADSVGEMQNEVKAFLDALRAYCGTNMANEEADNGCEYDDDGENEDALQMLCERVGVDDWREILVRDFGLSSHACNLLIKARIHCLGELVEFSRFDLLKIRNLGAMRLVEIEDRLRDFNLELKPVDSHIG